MATHGRISVRNAEHKEDEIILYAWHDGHTKDAIKLLLEMPLILHEYSREMSRNWWLHGKRSHGPWYFDHHLSFALKPDSKRWTREDVEEAFSRGLPLQIHTAAVANWISFIHFDRWTVVPNLKWCAYPGDRPDIIVDVDDGGYLITVPSEDELGLEQYNKVLEETIPQVNASIKNKDSRIEIRGKHRKLTTKKTAMALPQVYVPLYDMAIDLMWQDIQRAYDVLDKKVEPDPHILKLYEKEIEFKERWERERAEKKVKK